MTNEEKRRMLEDAIESAAENGAIMVTAMLKSAAEQDQPATAPAAPAVAPATAPAPAPAAGAAAPNKTLLDYYDEYDKDLFNWGERNFGEGYGNYASTGVGMAGLGALYGLLFGDKKHGTWNAILNNAALFGGLGIGGQYLKNRLGTQS